MAGQVLADSRGLLVPSDPTNSHFYASPALFVRVVLCFSSGLKLGFRECQHTLDLSKLIFISTVFTRDQRNKQILGETPKYFTILTSLSSVS